MLKPLNTVIIGTGHVAHHIASSFRENAEISLVQVFNHRKTTLAKSFSATFGVPLVNNYEKLHILADIYILCIKDSALPEVVNKLAALNLKGVVVHTSGSTDLSVLKNASKHTGVYYPLQTFTRGAAVNWKTTPLLIEGNTRQSLKTIKQLAGSVSNTVKVVNSVTRLKLHVAAVFACNFTNALYAAAFGYIEANLSKKDTALLKPIMLQSFLKLESLSPRMAQTGPAMRNDQVVIKKHLALLKSDKQLTAVYKLLSDLIMKQQH